MHKMKLLFSIFFLIFLSSCASGLTVIPRSGGSPVPASYKESWGQASLSMNLPSGETLQGNLIWIPPGGGVSTTIVNSSEGSAIATGMSSGNKGMYAGTIVGNRGTTMRIELLCNTVTGHCVGAGKTSDGVLYDIQR